MELSAYKMGVDGELEWLVRPAPVVAALAAILNLIWRRQVLRFLAFLTGYLALISRYGNSCVVYPLVNTLKLAVLKLYSENAENPAINNNNSTNVTNTILTAPKTPEHADEVHCQILHDPGEGNLQVDVIFIHGLHGSLRNTWRQGMWSRSKSPDKRVLRTTRSQHGLRNLDSSSGSHDEEPYATCWPRDWIPRDIPSARVIALNYTTDPYLWRPIWVSEKSRSCLVQRSRKMARLLKKQGVGERPIVWVAHSKGGLFVKQLLVDAWEKEGGSASMIQSSKGICFYSVPHRGSALALIDPPLLRQSIELVEVKKDSPQVLDLHEKFLRLCEEEPHFEPQMLSFFETKLTLMSILFLRIVSPESADPDIGELCGVHVDHRQICKPRSRNCFLYRGLIELIEKVISNC